MLSESEFQERVPVYERLGDELAFAVRQGLQAADLKIHSLATRVKSYSSLQEKAERKGYDDLLEADDVVGARVVTLFLSDLPQVEEIVRARFEILSTEDKVAGEDPDTFGYMSKHYVGTLKPEHSGPRYDDLKGIRFEVQVRTILMDAWASVSHYLAYKGEASIPKQLRRDFSALSGLFYVADQHFEKFFGGVIEARSAAEEEIDAPGDQAVEINLETVMALIRRKYSDREAAGAESVSQFVEEISEAGYTDLRQLDEALSKATPFLDEYEAEDPPGGETGTRYSDLGIARGALAIADPGYDELKYGDRPMHPQLRQRLEG